MSVERSRSSSLDHYIDERTDLELDLDVKECELSVEETRTVPMAKGDWNVVDFEKEYKRCMTILKLFLDNKTDEGLSTLRSRARDNFLNSEGFALLIGLDGLLSLDKQSLGNALRSLSEAMEYADIQRKKDTSYLFKSEPNSYTDVECHAEQSFHELQLAYGFLVVLHEQSLIGFIKGAVRLRSGFNGLKSNQRILDKKTNWSSQYLRDEFAAGVIGCLGMFDMVISFFPRKFIRLLELVGFSGDRVRGLEAMEKVAACSGTMRALGGYVGVGFYHGFFEFFYGLGEPNRELSQKIVDDFLSMTSVSYLADFAQAWRHQILGQFDESLVLYKKYATHPDIPRKFIYGSYWQQAWIYAAMWDWSSALEAVRVLKDQCKWSRALFAYMFATFASMLVFEEGRDDLRPMVLEILESIPGLKRHLGGKKAFHEKMVIDKSKLYAADMSKMVFAPLDLVYLWNVLSFASYNETSIPRYLEKITAKLVKYSKTEFPDPYAYLTFMKGVCLSRSGDTASATECLLEVIQMEPELVSERHLIPQANFEMGLICRATGEVAEGRKWLKKSKSFSGYLTETMINFRADVALDSLG